MNEIINKVKQSRLKTLDLEDLVKGETIRELDLKQFLFQELLLKEKDFRDNLDNHDWAQYQGAWLAVYCSADAIIPSWALMLLVAHASPYTKDIIYGNRNDGIQAVLRKKIDSFDWEQYRDAYVLLKGCSKVTIPGSAYLEVTKKLIPVVSKLMYGEACSNVPVYRKT